MTSSGYVSTSKCAGTVGCSCYIIELNCNIISNWQLLGCASVAFSERCVRRILFRWYERVIMKGEANILGFEKRGFGLF
jgi:hypothetical protein